METGRAGVREANRRRHQSKWLAELELMVEPTHCRFIPLLFPAELYKGSTEGMYLLPCSFLAWSMAESTNFFALELPLQKPTL